MIHMSKKLVTIIALVVAFVLCIALFSSCVSKPRIAGHWVLREIKGSSGRYPESITIRSDGTGLMDGANLSWYTDGHTLTLTTIYENRTFNYKIVNGSLVLNGSAIYKKH